MTTSDAPQRRFVDHPAPGVGLMTVLFVCLGVIVASSPAVFELPRAEVPAEAQAIIGAVIALCIAILFFYFWPLYATYYTLEPDGLTVAYGPWKRKYPWQDFSTAYWQKGMFVTRIGWPSVTPCVRLTNGVVLKRKARFFGLYLTPNDPAAFLDRIEAFAPELTREMIR